jgi:hypothetical protein
VEDESASQATEKGNPRSGSKNFLPNRVSGGAPPESPIVLVKWYDYAKWVLERVENEVGCAENTTGEKNRFCPREW